MNWDFNNDIPIYTQLVDKMKIAIVTGEFEKGGKLPYVREIASQAGMNPNAVQRAMLSSSVRALSVPSAPAAEVLSDRVAAVSASVLMLGKAEPILVRRDGKKTQIFDGEVK